ncbi:orotidine-5'-phosphate decarboxylase [Bacillus canaveralius]|uniref:Orotidine 5'-phosphate decarboxylase n=1 Tax=Bacillus canaveralius TaxID=1403243 RepID=A0A2N5GNY0_9BACI|nr:orotidine-5'-phosphate decarboxylase [Bacillus canaveralius]PLR84149.1 orotidine-5'-phosphate decarboxylase [Bacillus canaveralius]PLR96205.1 orotidine-5'-phosphate decarboxylase [Bacillus canaveralius]
MNNPLIIALDFADKREVFHFINQFSEEKLFLKVGMELFYQEGPVIVDDLKERGHQVFLDLKLHDIPNTVKKAMKGIARLGADLVNVHAAGGKAMMTAALEGLDSGTGPGNSRPYCIAVTQLTSTSEQQMKSEQLIAVSLRESVIHYAVLTKDAGLNGVVCSPHEAKMIHDRLGSDFYTVTPGIRLETDDIQDQKRVATPGFARQAGVSAIVVGRSITKAADPLQRYFEVKKEWEETRQ